MADKQTIGKNSFTLPKQYESYLMDALLFIAILSIQPLLKQFLTKEIINSGNNMQQYSVAVGWLYVATSLAQGFGALLLRKQVAFRLQATDRPSYKLFPVLALIIMHFIIFGILLWVDGMKYINRGSIPFWAYLLMFFPTIAAVLIIIPGNKIETAPVKMADIITGYIGTLLLALSALVALTVFWNLFMEDLGKEFFSIYSSSTQSAFTIVLNKLLISLLFAALFLLFYAPSRLVFLATDWHKRNTWISMLIVFSPFLIGLWTGEE